MSWNLRSRNIGRPSSAKARTPSGPWAEKNSSPSFSPPTWGLSRCGQIAGACSRSVVSRATKTGFEASRLFPVARPDGKPLARFAGSHFSWTTLLRVTAIQPFAQFLAGAEKWRAFLAHRNRLAGARIATHARRPHLDRESAKTAQLHAMAFGQALVMLSSTVVTIRSTSRWYRCGYRAVSRATSSDLIIPAPTGH